MKYFYFGAFVNFFLLGCIAGISVVCTILLQEVKEYECSNDDGKTCERG